MTIGALVILQEAERAGMAALEKCTPVPMVVTGGVPGEKSKEYFVADGVCGFAMVKVPGTSWFIRELKRIGEAVGVNDNRRAAFYKDSYAGGYVYSVREGNQSMQKKEAFAEAFSEVLTQHGIKNRWSSRMD